MDTAGDWFEDLQAQAGEDSSVVSATPQQARATAGRVRDDLQERHPTWHAIAGNRYDEHLYRQAKGSVDALSETLEQVRHTYPSSEQLAADLLRAFYQLEPHEQPVTERFQRNAAAIHDLLSTTDYKRLHSLTQLDGFASALATASMTEALVEILAKQEQEDPRQKRPQSPVSRRRASQSPQQPSAAPAQPAKHDGTGGQSGETEGKMTAEQERESLQAMQRRVVARRAAQQAEQEIADAQEALATFGGGPDALGDGWGSGEGTAHLQGDIQARAKLAQRLLQSAELRRIAALCGRMKLIAAQIERTRLTLGNSELYGVTIGDDVSNMLPTELALLSRPALKRLFYARLAEKSLSIYERYSPEPVGRGPIIVAVDESGSMSGAKNEWAKAIVLALLSIAAKQRRDLRVIHFASQRSLLVEDYLRGKGTPEQVMKTVLHFFGGGTDYEHWMRQTLIAIESSEYDRADVIALSDGECGVSDEVLKTWQATKAARGFRAIGILTGAPMGGAILRQFCDEVQHFKGVTNDQAILEQVFTMTV